MYHEIMTLYIIPINNEFYYQTENELCIYEQKIQNKSNIKYMNRNCPLVKTYIQFNIKYKRTERSLKSEVTASISQFHFSFLGTIRK